MQTLRRTRAGAALAAAVVAVVALVACSGGGNPMAPSPAAGAAGVALNGMVLGAGSATAGAGTLALTGAITVSLLENPAIATVVGSDGSFTLRGLPTGSFTLVFTRDGLELGRFTFAEVRPNQEIAVTVQLVGGTLTLVEEKRDGIGHGDIELEGRVEAVLALNPAGDSRFTIDGHEVVVRPGQTAIREGNRARTINDLTVGRQVHVKGSWLPPESKLQGVLASEIVLQGGDDTAPPPDPKPSCATGPNAQVEGVIGSKQASAIVVRQTGKGDYQCLVSSGTSIRKGNTSYTFAQLQMGWRVHVSGNGTGFSGGVCVVQADEIKVQQN